MSVDFRLPNITGSDREKLEQIRSYLYQFIPQLQFALNSINTTGASNYVASQTPKVTPQSSSKDAEVAFAELKPLIIKSADIVQAYYEEINSRLEGLYVAESDFGTFVEQTSQSLLQSSTGIEQLFANTQSIITEIDNLNFTLAETKGYIKSGEIDRVNEIPVYGLEIGQTVSTDGEEVFNKFARFTSDRLSFYDQNDSEIAYVSNYKLYIRNVEITSNFKIGGYIDTVTADGGIVTKWVGGGN